MRGLPRLAIALVAVAFVFAAVGWSDAQCDVDRHQLFSGVQIDGCADGQCPNGQRPLRSPQVVVTPTVSPQQLGYATPATPVVYETGASYAPTIGEHVVFAGEDQPTTVVYVTESQPTQATYASSSGGGGRRGWYPGKLMVRTSCAIARGGARLCRGTARVAIAPVRLAARCCRRRCR